MALLPMKGESVRVPNKNMRMFNGAPLCAVMIDKLCALDMIDLIVINTDSQEIATFAQNRSKKVRVLQRPKNLLGHDVSMNRIIEHDIQMIPAEIYLQTHSTNPMLTGETIARALTAFIEQRQTVDSLFSVTRHQTRFYDSAGVAINHDPDDLVKTQDLPPLYEENSCIYAFTQESFQEEGKRIGRRPLFFSIDPIEAIDIDVEEEFSLAEKLHKVL